MADPKAAWGMEIGADGIKAIRLEREGDAVQVSDFAVIPHKKVLTTPDLDREEMVRLSLGQFISQKSLENEHLVMSVPGHAAFARFAKLPPVEPKKVPDIVKFEAVQQIPFPIDEVEWDYQTFTSDDSPEIEVGIFAITRDRVQARLSLYAELGISPEALTLSPVALYNAMAFDLDLIKRGKPVIFLDIGTQATDVVIADEGRCWIRTFPLGGTHFTEAIANAFKLSYSKAERLKKEASTSKYAKQIMQAMRPVFSDLLQDLQRSIGYYQSLHRENDLETMVGIGSTFKIPGLRKFIGQQLQINVMRLDEFKRISVTGREAASFAENTVNMATAYGLALQGVGLAPIAANLVPVKALREQMWHAKTKWFAAAAAIIVAGAAAPLWHPLTDRGQLAATEPPVVDRVVRRGNALKSEFMEAQQSAGVGYAAENIARLMEDRAVWPHILRDATAALAAAEPQPVLKSEDPAAILEIDPRDRRLVRLTELAGDYVPPAGPNGARRINVTMMVELSHDRPVEFLNEHVAGWLRTHAEPEGDRADVPYRILEVSCNPALLTEIAVDASGRGEAGDARRPTGFPGGGRTPAGRGGAGLPGVSAPPAPGRPAPRQPPGAMSGGSTPSGMPALGGGEGRRAPVGKRQPPGAMGGGSTPSASGAPSVRPGGSFGAPVGGPGLPAAGAPPAAEEETHADLDEMAPLPVAPALFPPGSKYYAVPVTFVVEIVDGDQPAQPQTAAAAGRTGGA